MQDLRELTGEWDCLLPLTDRQTKLTANLHAESKEKQCQNHLSESTLAALMPLETDADTVMAGAAENISLSSASHLSVKTANTPLPSLSPPFLLNNQHNGGRCLTNIQRPFQNSLQQSEVSLIQIYTVKRDP